MRETDASDVQGIFRVRSARLRRKQKTPRLGGSIAGNARKEIEEATGKPVITPKNAIDFGRLISDVAKEFPKKEDEPEEDK